MKNGKKEFSKKEDYKLSGKTFCVIVTHWHTNGYPDVGIAPKEHWCLYVVIGNTHPLFKEACDNGEDQYGYDHGDKIYPNWHGGCTFYDKQETYVKIGCDYQHVWDEQYWNCTEMPGDVEDDARDLFKFFEDAEQVKLQCSPQMIAEADCDNDPNCRKCWKED